MYVYMYVYIYIYIYLYLSIYIYIYIYISIYIYLYLYLYIYIYIYIYIYCTAIHAFHRFERVFVRPLKMFYYHATWAATRRLQRIYLYLWRYDVVMHGAYYGSR